MKNIYIIGAGMGSPELLTTQATLALKLCDEIYAFDRMAELLSDLHNKICNCSYAELIPFIMQSQAETIGVLVSGDTGFFSAASLLNDKLTGDFQLFYVPGINSLQYLCSKLKISYENVPVVSLHGRNRSILGSLAYNRYTFVLTGSDHNATAILNELCGMGLGEIKVTVGEFLSMKQERVVTGTVQELMEYSFDNLSVLLFENGHPVLKEKPLFDEELIREKTPMTKQEVRWASIHNLDLKPSDIVFDIGAGTGSVSIEMARKVYEGVVYAIEKDESAYSLLYRNKDNLGAYNLITKCGKAMDYLVALPIPDKAFIGGSGKELREILAYLFQANPKIRIVINAISLETLSIAITLLKEHNRKVEVTCMNVSKSKQLGDYNLMMANNPVYIIATK